MVCNFIQLTKIKLNDDDIQEDPPKFDLGSGAENSLNTLPHGSTSKREKSPTKSMTSTTSYVHIPGFLGMVILSLWHIHHNLLHTSLWYYCVLLCITIGLP